MTPRVELADTTLFVMQQNSLRTLKPGGRGDTTVFTGCVLTALLKRKKKSIPAVCEGLSLPLHFEAILKAERSTFWLFCKLHSSSYQAVTLEIFPLLLFPPPKHLCEGVTSGY